MTERIQRKRVKGWVAPDGCIMCTRPGKYGNPYQVARAAAHLRKLGYVYYVESVYLDDTVWFREQGEAVRIRGRLHR